MSNSSAIQGLVRELRSLLNNSSKTNDDQAFIIAKAAIAVWEEVRRFIYIQENAISVLPISDPGYKWLRELFSSVIGPKLLEQGALGGKTELRGWDKNRFAFLVFTPPGADGEDILLEIVESMQAGSVGDWLASQTLVNRAILERADSVNLLRRMAWAAIAHWTTLKRGQGTWSKGPVFVCLQGENLKEEAMYEIQDLANRTNARFLILGCSKDPKNFHLEFGDGRIDESLFNVLPIINAPLSDASNGDLVGTIEHMLSNLETVLGHSVDTLIPFDISKQLIKAMEAA